MTSWSFLCTYLPEGWRQGRRSARAPILNDRASTNRRSKTVSNALDVEWRTSVMFPRAITTANRKCSAGSDMSSRWSWTLPSLISRLMRFYTWRSTCCLQGTTITTSITLSGPQIIASQKAVTSTNNIHTTMARCSFFKCLLRKKLLLYYRQKHNDLPIDCYPRYHFQKRSLFPQFKSATKLPHSVSE